MDRNLGAWLVGVGLVIAVLGGLAWAGWLRWFGHLPGDIRVNGANTKVLIPITSMLLVSVALSVIVSLVRRR